MDTQSLHSLKLFHKLFKSHPWHGVSIGKSAPDVVQVYVEIVPTDTIKYETDKESGILSIDRPQRYSNICPAIYGFIPQTYCDEKVAALCREKTGLEKIKGDGDPLDVCILSERTIPHGDILLCARPIGGLRMIDKGEADDKVIAVLDGDPAFAHINDLSDCPPSVIDRLCHYFLTYKLAPGSTENGCKIAGNYGKEEAKRVIRASNEDYEKKFPELVEALRSILDE